MAARPGGAVFWLFVVALLFSGACAIIRGSTVARIALLAPFEGRYREVGYDALYAARLALADSGRVDLELFPVDDGGTMDSAADRARALVQDPLVKTVILLGYPAASADAQRALADLPALIVGQWLDQPNTDSIFALTNRELPGMITHPHINVVQGADLEGPVVGGEIFALKQYPRLGGSLDGITIVSSAALPDGEFTERYRRFDQFAPDPGLLSTLTYDAVGVAIQAITNGDQPRHTVREMIAGMRYEGLNGTIRFKNGYWVNAPIHFYGYDNNRELTAIDNVVK